LDVGFAATRFSVVFGDSLCSGAPMVGCSLFGYLGHLQFFDKTKRLVVVWIAWIAPVFIFRRMLKSKLL